MLQVTWNEESRHNSGKVTQLLQGINQRENVSPHRSERETEVSRRLLFNSVSCFSCGRHMWRVPSGSYWRPPFCPWAALLQTCTRTCFCLGHNDTSWVFCYTAIGIHFDFIIARLWYPLSSLPDGRSTNWTELSQFNFLDFCLAVFWLTVTGEGDISVARPLSE